MNYGYDTVIYQAQLHLPIPYIIGTTINITDILLLHTKSNNVT
jgi:hypothetical protein